MVYSGEKESKRARETEKRQRWSEFSVSQHFNGRINFPGRRRRRRRCGLSCYSLSLFRGKRARGEVARAKTENKIKRRKGERERGEVRAGEKKDRERERIKGMKEKPAGEK